MPTKQRSFNEGQGGEGEDGTGKMEKEGERVQNLGVRSGSLSPDCLLET